MIIDNFQYKLSLLSKAYRWQRAAWRLEALRAWAIAQDKLLIEIQATKSSTKVSTKADTYYKQALK